MSLLSFIALKRSTHPQGVCLVYVGFLSIICALKVMWYSFLSLITLCFIFTKNFDDNHYGLALFLLVKLLRFCNGVINCYLYFCFGLSLFFVVRVWPCILSFSPYLINEWHQSRWVIEWKFAKEEKGKGEKILASKMLLSVTKTICR